MRIRVTALVTAAFLCATVCTAPAQTGQTLELKLKRTAVVKGDTFTLHDVAEIAENPPAGLRDLTLGNAPWPGHVRGVTRALIRMRLASGGFDQDRVRFTGPQQCRVSVKAVRIEPEKLVQAARERLQQRLPDSEGRPRIELMHPVEPLVVAAGDQPVLLRASVPASGAPLGRVPVAVAAIRAGTRLARRRVSFSVGLVRPVAVATGKIRPGERLDTHSVKFEKRDIGSVRGKCVDSPELLADRQAARRIRPGQIVTCEMLEPVEQPFVIKYHERVYLVVETEGLRVITLGRSLCKARRGQTARAENLATGRHVVGVAAGDSTVKVLLEDGGREPENHTSE